MLATRARSGLIPDDVRIEANQLLERTRDAKPDGLAVRVEGEIIDVPENLGRTLLRLLEQVAQGGTVMVQSMPLELTTTAAADVLGVSRPTLMKLIAAQELPSHMVGTHHRLMTKDVFELRRKRAESRGTAFEKLRALEAELDAM